jgi:hypothetical protein
MSFAKLESKLESVSWGARRIGVKEQRVYNLIAEGFFPVGIVVRIGRQIKICPERLEEFLAAGGAALPGGWKREADGMENSAA